MRAREVAKRSEGMAHVGGLPGLTPGTYTSIVRRPVRHDIPSRLHSYAPLLSSIHTGIEPRKSGVRFRYSHGTFRLWIGRRSVDLKKALGLSASRPTVGSRLRPGRCAAIGDGFLPVGAFVRENRLVIACSIGLHRPLTASPLCCMAESPHKMVGRPFIYPFRSMT